MTHPALPVCDPARPAPAAVMLRQYLQVQRDLVAWKLADADVDALQAVATPSGLRPLGALRHSTQVETVDASMPRPVAVLAGLFVRNGVRAPVRTNKAGGGG